MGRNGLGDQILVLDGLDLSSAEVVAAKGEDALSIAAGGTVSGGSSWEPGIPTIYGRSGLAADFDLTSKMDLIDYIVYPEKEFMNYMNDIPTLPPRKNVIDASRGGNYSGGSSYSPGLPLTPSNSGLASEMRMPRRQPLNMNVRQVMPGYQTRSAVIDPSAGANYSGGSDFYAGAPLLPSTNGLADLADMAALDALASIDMQVRQVSPGFQVRNAVIDPSAGANYSGGSDFYAGAPLMPSTSGLAGCGSCGDAATADLMGYAQTPRMAMPGVILKNNVIDPSGGANYGGGSSYAAGFPLMPSSVGLAAEIVDLALSPRFASAAARNLFTKLGGEKHLLTLRMKRSAALLTGDRSLVPGYEKQIAVVNTFRNSVANVVGKINEMTVKSLYQQANAQVQTTAQLRGLGGLQGLNADLEALEGRIAQKIKKAVKKVAPVAKVIAKVVKPFAKIAMTAVGIPPLPYAQLAKKAVGAVKKGVQVKAAIRRC